MTCSDLTIEVRNLTKHFGAVRAVENLTFSVPPGRITGFLGPNGAGKTTTLRMLLSLVTPTSGTATIGGKRYRELTDPLRTVGAALEATGFHPGRSARNHLRVLAATAEIPDTRVDEMLATVGLSEVGQRRVGTFSLGMRQRLALAAALLGDPPVLLLDEPANGLDPEGIAWLRGFLRYLAGQGRTVLVSSHVLFEVEQTVDDVVIVARGQLVRHAPLADLRGGRSVLTRTPTPGKLAAALTEAGLTARPTDDGALRVMGADAAQVGAIAFAARVELHELRSGGDDLEAVFLSLTSNGDTPAPGNQPGDDPGNQPGGQPGNHPGDQPGNHPGDAPTPGQEASR